MIGIIQDLYWWLFGKSAEVWCEEHKTCPAITGLTKWGETDYYSFSSRPYRGRSFKTNNRILQPGETA